MAEEIQIEKAAEGSEIGVPHTGAMIKIRLIRSPICTPKTHKIIVRSLGLKKINRVVQRPDTPGFRGMVAKVPHLLEIVKE
jgi:large subunit ribosomal protein L30